MPEEFIKEISKTISKAFSPRILRGVFERIRWKIFGRITKGSTGNIPAGTFEKKTFEENKLGRVSK